MCARSLDTWLWVAAAVLMASPVQARPAPEWRPADPSELCVGAVVAAERRHGIPPGLLLAIGDIESGRLAPSTNQRQPWPWTVNANGQGFFFNSLPQAATWVHRQQSSGVQSIDIGCLQINLMHHPTAFRTIEDAFDPAQNAEYGARFLLALFRASGNWTEATGSYHSQTVALAEPYRRRVAAAFVHSVFVRRQSILGAMDVAWRATIKQNETNTWPGADRGPRGGSAQDGWCRRLDSPGCEPP